MAERATDRYAIVMSRYMLGGYAALVGKLDEADQHLRIAIEAAGGADPDARPHHVPLVMAPVAAGDRRRRRGEADEARVHAHRRTPAWLSDRAQIDPTTQSAFAFNSALIEALLGAPEGVLERLENVETTDANGLVPTQVASCRLLQGWARSKLGDSSGATEALEALQPVESNPHHTLKSAMVTFAGEALLDAGDEQAVEVLERARQHALVRGEVWWLSETVRLQALADTRFRGGRRADEFLDEARRLAQQHSARIVLERLSN